MKKNVMLGLLAIGVAMAQNIFGEDAVVRSTTGTMVTGEVSWVDHDTVKVVSKSAIQTVNIVLLDSGLSEEFMKKRPDAITVETRSSKWPWDIPDNIPMIRGGELFGGNTFSEKDLRHIFYQVERLYCRDGDVVRASDGRNVIRITGKILSQCDATLLIVRGEKVVGVKCGVGETYVTDTDWSGFGRDAGTFTYTSVIGSSRTVLLYESLPAITYDEFRLLLRRTNGACFPQIAEFITAQKRSRR